MLRRLDDIVAAARNEAAADEGYIRQRVECSQFANRIDQEDSAGHVFAIPL